MLNQQKGEKKMSEEKKFISVDYDEFNEKTTTQHSNALKWGGFLGKLVNEYENIKLRHVKTPKLDALMLDFSIKSSDWFHLRSGKLTLNCDQDNINLEFHESETNARHIGDTLYCFEYGFYQISKEELEKVCNANVLKIRVSGDTTYEQPAEIECQAFQTYCQQFYNNFYDETKYTDSLNVAVGKSGGACFIATATMGDYNHPSVMRLRFFRDAYLLQRNWGRIFTRLYYKWGPYPANAIKKSDMLKTLSYYTIVKPLSFIASKLIEKK